MDTEKKRTKKHPKTIAKLQRLLILKNERAKIRLSGFTSLFLLLFAAGLWVIEGLQSIRFSPHPTKR
jgi:hypothetical protein